MQELDNCLELARIINSYNEKIKELETNIKYPKSQQFGNKPGKTNQPKNSMDFYLVRKENLKEKQQIYIQKLDAQWIEARQLLGDIDSEKEKLIYLRFYKGLSWKQCGNILKWNENKVFRNYRKVLKNAQKGN